MERAVMLENSSKNSLHELLEPLSGKYMYYKF